MAIATRSTIASRAAVRPSRATTVVVRASSESRRAVLGGFLAGAVTLAAGSAQAISPVDLFDDRGARGKGFDIIYEARDLDLDQATRDGMSQARANVEATIKRAKASEARIDAELEPFIQKAYWTEAREQLRRQVGTLRFDLKVLAAKKDKAARKAAEGTIKTFANKVEALDFAIRKKDKDSALTKLADAKSALDAAIASVL